MTKRLAQIVLLLIQFNLLAISFTHAQVNEYKPIKELEWRALTGEVYFLPFFINTPNGEFEEEEIEYYLAELAKSKDWIMKQSYNYPNVDLEIIDDYVESYEEEIYLDNVKNWNQGGNNNIANNVARYLHYKDIKEYVSFQSIDINKSKVVVLCFVKQNGRSHAIDFNGSIFADDISIDNAVIFCNTKPGIYTSYKVITHEILHLFRAWDLYGGEPQNEAKAKKLKEMYPNSIMLSTYGNTVPILDEINAWRVGWNLNPENFYTEYKPEYIENMSKMAKKKNTITFDLKGKKKKTNEEN